MTNKPAQTSEDTCVVFCGATMWDASRLPDRHIAERLSRTTRVLWVNPPSSVVSLYRGGKLSTVTDKRVTRVEPNLAILTPLVLPAMRRPGIERVTEWLMRAQIRRALKQLGWTSRARVVTSDLMLFERGNDERKVLYAMDDLAAGAEFLGISPQQLITNEARQTEVADVVVCVSPTLVKKWESKLPCMLIPNGCDTDIFADVDSAPDAPDVTLPHPIVGIVGHLTDRIDFDMLDAVVSQGTSLLLVGHRPVTATTKRLDDLIDKPNVQWVGSKRFEEMPSYLKAIDLGITPYVDNEFNRASFPLKTLEYLAAGRSAVITDLPAHRWLECPLVDIALTPAEFAERVQERLVSPLEPNDVAERRRFALTHSWNARADEFLEVLQLDEATGGRPS